MIAVFFAYAGRPEGTRETVATAATYLDREPDVVAKTWEQLRVGGQVIVQQITKAIDDTDIFCAEVSSLNANVLFELGYAVARRKPVCILLDTTDSDAMRAWKQFGLLGQIGHTAYANALDIKSRVMDGFISQPPDPLWNDLIGTTVVREHEHSVFYLPLNHMTEASRTLTRRLQNVDRRGWDVISADHSEVSLAPLSWYVQQIYKTDASIIHLAAPRRTNANVHNARGAWLAGLAHGLGRNLLITAEEDFSPPFDYQDLLRRYSSARQLGEIFGTWFTGFEGGHGVRRGVPEASQSTDRVRPRTKLQTINFYEYVAEQEAASLSDYFVRTREFEQVLESQSIIFVGRKGVGKTANMLQASETLRDDKRNLVCVIKPNDYELRGVLEVLERFRGRESRSYLIENMWKLLLYSEIAKTAVELAEARPAGIESGSPLAELRDFIDRSGMALREDFSVRFETVAQSLLDRTDASIVGVAEARDNIGAALGGVLMRDLRRLLEKAVTRFERVALLVDNLDKAWDRHADLDDLSFLLLGLLTAIGRVGQEFRRAPSRGRVNDLAFTLAVFLRSDVYQHLLRVAREPDKIKAANISWNEREVLFRVVEERFLSSGGARSQESTAKLWRDYFCPVVNSIETRQYIFEHVLPRPRDLLYLVNAAVANAVNANRKRVEAEDLLRAEKSYSQFAFEAALVPNGISSEKLEELLFEFAAGPAHVSVSQIQAHCQQAALSDAGFEIVLDHLLDIEFLGREVGENRYVYGAGGKDARLAEVLARKRASETRSERQYRIHPAFWAYLEIR